MRPTTAEQEDAKGQGLRGSHLGEGDDYIKTLDLPQFLAPHGLGKSHSL